MSGVADRLREHVRMRALVAHGGGPTAVLNASLAGLVSRCRGRYESLVASAFGFEGLLSGRLTDLLSIPEERWATIRLSPGSVIGSSRKAFDPEAVATALREAGIDTVFLTGGNGTMRTALELSRRGVRVTGIPKTIDNDLAVTHHSPGYASTAYFFACAARDIGMDVAALPSPICVLETLGRNTGWITAATALGRRDEGDAPHVVLLPEARRSLDDIAAEVERVYRKLGRVVIAVCEGQLDEKGLPFGADVDRPEIGHYRLASNLGHTLAQALSAKLGVRARAERPGLLGRSCGEYARPRDLVEAFACGQAAAGAEGGVMIALNAAGGTFEVPLGDVAGVERGMPPEFVADSQVFLRYLEPLTGPVEPWASTLVQEIWRRG